jgi:galactokinase
MTKRNDAGLLSAFERYVEERGGDFFEPGKPIIVGRGPARIDVMGGIADYSGSVVFEGTLGQAAVVAFQPRFDGLLRVRSTALEDGGKPCEVEIPLGELRNGNRPLDYAGARARLTASKDESWAAYVLGAIVVLETEGLMKMKGGGNFLLWSDVPIGVGVASSAAVEVATMYTLASALRVKLPGERLAALAQVVENHIVGAPCGIMDQVTSALGESGKLLALRCQPCTVLGLHEMPPGVAVFGISSHVKHSVGGDAYTTARVSAFMGLKVILTAMEKQGRRLTKKDYYLCNISPAVYRDKWRALLPDRMNGADFLARYGGTTDSVTSVNPAKTYNVRLGAEHPIFENYRVQAFIECMERAHAGDRTALVEAGGLMYASHCSYGWNCGLGCPETDLIVDLVRQRGPERGLYGAKITGGGSGGTVAILADKTAEPHVREVAAEYRRHTGLSPDVFDSTSPGAYAFGTRKYKLIPE